MLSTSYIPLMLERGHAWWVMLQSLHRWLVGGVSMAAGHYASAEGVQASAGHGASVGGVQVSAGTGRGRSSAGRVVLRLRMPRATYDWWRGLERCARRWLPRAMSWLSFLCLSMWRAWRHLLGADMAYGGIYIRDRFRCRSPVCERRDVTPHHVQFRSAGGSDEASNVVAMCSECHLFGIHGGRIRASGAAEHLRWELGRRGAPCVVVEGRQRVAA